MANSVCVCCVTTSTVLLRLGVMRSAYAAILDLDYAVLQAEVGLGLASPIPPAGAVSSPASTYSAGACALGISGAQKGSYVSRSQVMSVVRN